MGRTENVSLLQNDSFIHKDINILMWKSKWRKTGCKVRNKTHIFYQFSALQGHALRLLLYTKILTYYISAPPPPYTPQFKDKLKDSFI